MNRKLILAGAAVVALLGISIPLAYSGKLAKPEAKQTEQGIATNATGSESVTGAGQGQYGSASNTGNGSAGQSQTGQPADVSPAGGKGAGAAGETGTNTGGAAGSQSGTAAGGSQASGNGLTGSGSTGGSTSSTGTAGTTESNGSGGNTSGQTTNPAPPPTTSPEPAVLQVEVTIIGQNGETIFGPRTVSIAKDNKWGETAMGALHATGVPYRMHATYSTMVASIAGQANSGLNGWMYKVNGQPGNVAAPDKKVAPGDKVVWWYSIR